MRIVGIFRALGHRLGVGIGLLSSTSVLFCNVNINSKKIQKQSTLLKNSSYSLNKQCYIICFCGAKENGMSECLFFFFFFSNSLIPISSVIGMQFQSGGGRGIFGKKILSIWEFNSDLV